MRILRKHTFSSAWSRLSAIVRKAGLLQTLVICASELEEHFLGRFDRKYGISTGGYIDLRTTSFTSSRLRHANAYRPVNAWALRRLLRRLSLSPTLHFADLGCGLGRACIVAAEYGFSKVTGVELALELCEVAEKNASIFQSRVPGAPAVQILHADVLDYCENANADVFFMYRPFSDEFLHRILEKLAQRAVDQGKALTVIYSENVRLPESHADVFAVHQGFRKFREHSFLGFSFLVYKCGL